MELPSFKLFRVSYFLAEKQHSKLLQDMESFRLSYNSLQTKLLLGMKSKREKK